MFTLQLQAYMYKHRLSGALILLLDLQSGSTGEGSAVVLGEKDLGAQQKNRQHLQGLQGHCGTTLSAIGCTQDEVGNWNIIRNLITLELKKTLQRLSSSTKMMTVSPKCSTLVSGYQV